MELWILLLAISYFLLPLINIVTNLTIAAIPLSIPTMRTPLHIVLGLYCVGHALHSTTLVPFIISVFFDTDGLTQFDCFITQAFPILGTLSLHPLLLTVVLECFRMSITDLEKRISRNIYNFYIIAIISPSMLYVMVFLCHICYYSTTEKSAEFCAYWISLDDVTIPRYNIFSIVFNSLTAFFITLVTMWFRRQEGSTNTKIIPSIFIITIANLVCFILTLIGSAIADGKTSDIHTKNSIQMLFEIPSRWVSCMNLLILFHFDSNYKNAICDLLNRDVPSKFDTPALSLSRRRSTVVVT